MRILKQRLERLALAGALIIGVYQTTRAQTAPRLQISPVVADTWSVQWTSEVDTYYQLLFTENIDYFSLWAPVGDWVVATNTAMGLTVSTTTPTGFFKAHVLNQFTGLPTVCIASPPNGSTVSGQITIVVGAQDDSRLSVVDLFLDDVPIGSIMEGDLNFIVDTTHFANGTHTLVARAQDNAGLPDLGGMDNNLVVANEAYSASLTLDFQNPVRWPEAETLFQSYVPINVESDVYPADWTVVVEDLSGAGVKSFSGYTSDGLIQTNWDGTDANDNPVGADAGYKITVLVDSASSGMMMASSLAGTTPTSGLKRTGINRYGMPEFTMTERVPDELAAYNEQFKWYLSLTEQEKEELPPIPAAPQKPKSATRTKKVSLSHVLANRGVASRATAETFGTTYETSSASGTVGIVRALVWRENSWSSGKIILARQKYPLGQGWTFNAALGQMMNQLAVMISEAAMELGFSRDVYNDTVFVMQDQGGFAVLTNDLALSEVRSFYYHGHARPDGIGYGRPANNEGVLARDLQQTLMNLYVPKFSDTQCRYDFYKPFTFVFIDGCLSGKGELPEAFGIPKAISSATYEVGHRKKRAFLGWNSKTGDSIANTDYLNWSFKFWQTWLNDPDYDQPLQQAIDAANALYPGVANQGFLARYGSQTLRWRD